MFLHMLLILRIFLLLIWMGRILLLTIIGTMVIFDSVCGGGSMSGTGGKIDGLDGIFSV